MANTKRSTHLRWTRSAVGAALVGGVITLGAGPADAAATVAIDGAGRVTIRAAAGEPLLVTCVGGRIATGPSVSPVGCGAATSLLIVGTSAADTIDTRGVTRAVFTNLADPDAFIFTREIMIQGKGGNDALKGGALQEAIEGNDGDDVVRGGGGDDYLRGGNGTDVLKGGSGADYVSGQGDDLITGDAEPDIDDGFSDLLSGGAGATTYHLTNGDTYATCYDAAPDTLIVTVTGAGPQGAQPVFLADDGCGHEPGYPTPNVDMRIINSGAFTFSMLSANIGLRPEFAQARRGGWRYQWNPDMVGSLKLTLGSGSDTITIAQNTEVPITVDAGAGTDALIVQLAGTTYTDSGSVISSPGVEPITYARFQSKSFVPRV